MKKRANIYIIGFLCILTIFVFTGCCESIENSADELRLNDWSGILENESEISLSFDDDYATLKISNKNIDTVSISGLCEISENEFVIHDENTNTPFAFSYIVHFDRVEVFYNSNTVSLDKL